MPSRRTTIFRLLPAAAIFAAAVPLAVAAEPPEIAPLTGQLLIAAPTIGDPRFAHTVILMVRHDRQGAFGIVINRPVGESPIASLLEGAGEDVSGISGNLRIFSGGPVQQELGFVVHSTEYRLDETLDVDGRVAMTANRLVLRDIGHNRGPVKSLFALGYAGWGPGQLEGEIARRDWFTTPAEPRLIFDDDRANLWEDAMAHRTRDL